MSESDENAGEREITDRKFYPADEEANFAEAHATRTPQTEHPAYRLAFSDVDFLLREELRPVRFQLELLKTDMLLDEAGVGSTLVFYGSARIPPPEAAATALEGAKAMDDDARTVVERLVAKSKYYTEAYNLAKIASEKAIVEEGKRQFVVCSGGGPSIMEAANKGAHDADVESIQQVIVDTGGLGELEAHITQLATRAHWRSRILLVRCGGRAVRAPPPTRSM